MGGACTEIDFFPNATVSEYGMIDMDDDVVDKIKTEIFVRGPVAATINGTIRFSRSDLFVCLPMNLTLRLTLLCVLFLAEPIVGYKGGVFTDDSHSQSTNHIVSITGWGWDDDSESWYWIIRNSWGQYWGEMGYIRVQAGKNLLGIEGEVAWVTPGAFTIHNFPCAENGANCVVDDTGMTTQFYVDPAHNVAAVHERLAMFKPAVAEKSLRA